MKLHGAGLPLLQRAANSVLGINDLSHMGPAESPGP